MGVTLPASARRPHSAGCIGGGEPAQHGAEDLPQLADLLRGEPVEHVPAHGAHVARGGLGQRGEPASVSWARVLRRSSGHGERRTQPLCSSLLTACERRLCELCVTAARSLIRSVRPGTSESMARMR